ncbi:MAG: response regulator transcription factor [Crocinitomicaceae bacterium]|nr:response regulator transcription factor [Crocinitomicaceae bacterium]
MKKNLTCIIVDDELSSRETLNSYISKYCENVLVLALCKNIDEGLTAIKKHKPDIVFLDIEMPFGDGFDLLDQAGEINFDVVFITAFSHYAIKALNMSATYYILKPVDIDELTEAVKKIREKKNEPVSSAKILLENNKTNNPEQKQIVLPHLSGFVVVKIANVMRVEADNNYSTVYLNDGTKQVVSRTLKFFEELLNESGFIRIHQSHLINTKFISEFKKGKTAQVKLSDGVWLDISAQRKRIS